MGDGVIQPDGSMRFLYVLEILGILSLLSRIIKNNNLHLLIIVKCTPCNVSSSSFIIMTSDDILITFCEQVNMHMIYRDKFDIISDILGVASGGVTKIKIMYKTFLSYAQLRGYLTILTENNLLNYNVDTQTFRATEKGLRFLQMLNEMRDMIKKEQPSRPHQKMWIHN
jgi:predicted transcriptional regulator